ncbi:MAG: N-acyl homoserine lactonase family protein [Desulfobacterales bacterium]|nr:N-acyl homoserine lactonase family protein [Desulfobacterales bacterium]
MGTTYTIHPVVMGTKVFDKSMMTYQYGQGETYTIPIFTWIIKGGDKNILVDTGEMNPIQSEEREAAINGKIHTFEQGLALHGLLPSDIDIVIHTHLHMDHCENDYKCENARFFVHEKELEAVHNPHPLDYRYLEDYIEDVEENGQVIPLTSDTEIIEGIRVVHTPVHTRGGLTVFIDTPKGRAAITGFCIIDENYDPPPEIRGMEMDLIPPGTHVDVYSAYDIMARIRTEADILIPLHEPKFAATDCIGA